MTGKRYFLLLLQLLWIVADVRVSWAQHSPFSLQAAVDELHRREAAKYPLNSPPSQQHYFGSASDQDYWDDDSVFPATNTNNNINNKIRNRHRINKVLAKYLERENYDADHGGLGLGPFGGYEFDEDSNNFFNNYPEQKKRSSIFRERDNKYDNTPDSVFRERNAPEHSELTEQFLREIEETQERDREERYKEALRNLWGKYQQQENDIDGDLVEEKKRLRVPPYYMLMQKKRSSYPVLPWLPYSERKKRFPVAKRSTKRSANELNNNLGKTDDKVAKELSELFGTSTNDEKKKRSTDEQSAKVATTHVPDTASTAMTDMRLEAPIKKGNSTETVTKNAPLVELQHHQQHRGHLGEHGQKEHKHRKRSDRNSRESHEYEEDSESEEHDEDAEEEVEEEEHEEGEEEEERKKKRDLENIKQHSNRGGEVLRIGGHTLPADITNLRQKKSIQWSKYFGLDRKKKSMNNKNEVDMKKRSTEETAGDENVEKKYNLDPEKLDNMNKKLESIEDFIIDETIKYTGAHEGINNPDEIQRLKDHVLSRLATAYSLEKMRRALEKLRDSVDAENHLIRNVIEPEPQSNENDLIENTKRTAVKKEKASMHDHLQHLTASNEKSKELHSNAMMSAASSPGNRNGADDDDMKRKRKRNGYLRYAELPINEFSDPEEEIGGIGRYESLNDAYLGNKNYIIGSNQCPLIESMAERCRGVDLLSGDINQELLPICGVHQICYLCSTSQIACDYQYLAVADSICGNNDDCQAAARSVLMILRGAPGPQLGPRECLKNPCLYSAMREIGL